MGCPHGAVVRALPSGQRGTGMVTHPLEAHSCFLDLDGAMLRPCGTNPKKNCPFRARLSKSGKGFKATFPLSWAFGELAVSVPFDGQIFVLQYGFSNLQFPSIAEALKSTPAQVEVDYWTCRSLHRLRQDVFAKAPALPQLLQDVVHFLADKIGITEVRHFGGPEGDLIRAVVDPTDLRSIVCRDVSASRPAMPLALCHDLGQVCGAHSEGSTEMKSKGQHPARHCALAEVCAAHLLPLNPTSPPPRCFSQSTRRRPSFVCSADSDLTVEEGAPLWPPLSYLPCGTSDLLRGDSAPQHAHLSQMEQQLGSLPQTHPNTLGTGQTRVTLSPHHVDGSPKPEHMLEEPPMEDTHSGVGMVDADLAKTLVTQVAKPGQDELMTCVTVSEDRIVVPLLSQSPCAVREGACPRDVPLVDSHTVQSDTHQRSLSREEYRLPPEGTQESRAPAPEVLDTRETEMERPSHEKRSLMQIDPVEELPRGQESTLQSTQNPQVAMLSCVGCLPGIPTGPQAPVQFLRTELNPNTFSLLWERPTWQFANMQMANLDNSSGPECMVSDTLEDEDVTLLQVTPGKDPMGEASEVLMGDCLLQPEGEGADALPSASNPTSAPLSSVPSTWWAQLTQQPRPFSSDLLPSQVPAFSGAACTAVAVGFFSRDTQLWSFDDRIRQNGFHAAFYRRMAPHRWGNPMEIQDASVSDEMAAALRTLNRSTPSFSGKRQTLPSTRIPVTQTCQSQAQDRPGTCDAPDELKLGCGVSWEWISAAPMRTIRHIPKTLRLQWADLLSRHLSAVADEPQNPLRWRALMALPKLCLCSPPRRTPSCGSACDI